MAADIHQSHPFNSFMDQNYMESDSMGPMGAKPKLTTGIPAYHKGIDSNSECEQPSKSKKKKKNKKHSSLENNDNIPSTTSSLSESYKEAKRKAINAVSPLGFTDDQIKCAVSKLEADKAAISSEKLIDAIYEIQDEKCQNKLQTDGCCSAEESDDDSGNISSEEETYSYNMYKRDVEKEVTKYRDLIDSLTIKCRMCNDTKANILLLPCGHLASCESCLMDVRRCPIGRCNKIVRGTKEVFFA